MAPYEEYIEMIKSLWTTHRLTNMGEYHNRLEKELQSYLEVPKVSLTVNGHMALELSLQAFNFSPGSEVITTPFSFISTTHAIIRNHLKPVFCDIKETDYTIDENKIEDLVTERTVAIVPVHIFGNICNVEKIEKIACKYNLKVIYDAAHAFGETYKGIGVGNFGNASIFSFHATKVFNTIEGGAVCAPDAAMYEKLYNLKNFGIRGEELIVSIGTNAKMNEFSAAMGLCNLRYFKQEVEKRKQISEKYIEILAEQKGILVKNFLNPEVNYNYGYFPILIDEEEFGRTRDDVYDLLKQNNIFSRKYFYPLIVDQACFKNMFRDLSLPVARSISKHILALPLYGTLTESHLQRICHTLKK